MPAPKVHAQVMSVQSRTMAEESHHDQDRRYIPRAGLTMLLTRCAGVSGVVAEGQVTSTSLLVTRWKLHVREWA